MKRFPIGGEREPVYAFMRQHGFRESRWSDKVWERADGTIANIYGAGSRARISKDGKQIADGALDEVVKTW